MTSAGTDAETVGKGEEELTGSVLGAAEGEVDEFSEVGGVVWQADTVKLSRDTNKREALCELSFIGMAPFPLISPRFR
ncbi:MAG TPA: hypothetical protein V6D23_04185, partial [Candidatus Obscuribacterales bacterium]